MNNSGKKEKKISSPKKDDSEKFELPSYKEITVDELLGLKDRFKKDKKPSKDEVKLVLNVLKKRKPGPEKDKAAKILASISKRFTKFSEDDIEEIS